MADPTTKTFGQIVSQQAAAVQAYASGLLDFTTGAILRAVAQSVAALVLWLQGLVLLELARTRLSTSPTDADADSFVADFFGPFADGVPATFKRLGAVASSGLVTFTRLTPTGVAIVPAPDPVTGLHGATVSTQDGTQKFAVTIDTTNPAYNAGLGGYVMPNTVASVTVKAVATTPGAASNVLAGGINTITSPIIGVDGVANAADFTNGEDTELTAALEDRFRRQIIALREATPAAIINYVLTVQLGLAAVNVEFETPEGTPRAAYFYVIVDNGTGVPGSDLLNAVRSMVDHHRADGVEFSVIAPTVTTANITFGTVSALIDATPDIALAVAAVKAYVNALAIGEALILTRLYQIAYNASPTITDIVAMMINGSGADLAAPLPHVIKAGTVAST